MKQFTTHFPSRLFFLSALLVTLIFSGLLVQTSYGCTGLSEGTKANFDMLLQEMAGEKVMGRLVGQVEMADFLLSNLHSRTEEGRHISDPYLDEFNRVHTKFTQPNPADSFKKLYEAAKNGGTDERFGLLLTTPILSTLYMKMYSAGVKAAFVWKENIERR